MFDRIATPIIALGLAFLVWLYVRSTSQEVMERNVTVVFKMSPQQRELYDILEPTMEIPVSFTGPGSRIRELRAMFFRHEVTITRTITVPESHLQADRFTYSDSFAESQINVPPGIRVDIPPNRRAFQVQLKRMIRKPLKVRPRFALEDEERVANIVVHPAEVEVRGPQEVLAREEYLNTALIRPPENVPEKDEPHEKFVPLSERFVTERFGEVRITREPPGVNVTFTLKAAQRIHEVQDVPVQFQIPAGFPYTPKFISDRAGTITLKVKGPAQKPTDIRAFVDLTKKHYEKGVVPDEPIQVVLPPGYELAEPKPLRLPTFELVPVAGIAKPPG
jgi:hypothetical protein